MAYIKLVILYMCFARFAFCDSENSLKLMEPPREIRDCPDPATAVNYLSNVEYHQSGEWLRIITKTLNFPTNGNNTKPITCIIVTNLSNDGTGGYPEVIGGGVGYNYVEILLTSQRGRGLDFHIEIWTAE